MVLGGSLSKKGVLPFYFLPPCEGYFRHFQVYYKSGLWIPYSALVLDKQ
jgi:hypothetical protein